MAFSVDPMKAILPSASIKILKLKKKKKKKKKENSKTLGSVKVTQLRPSQ